MCSAYAAPTHYRRPVCFNSDRIILTPVWQTLLCFHSQYLRCSRTDSESGLLTTGDVLCSAMLQMLTSPEYRALSRLWDTGYSVTRDNCIFPSVGFVELLANYDAAFLRYRLNFDCLCISSGPLRTPLPANGLTNFPAIGHWKSQEDNLCCETIVYT